MKKMETMNNNAEKSTENTIKKSSEYLISKLCEFEGLCLKAYKCPAGIWTIGYGHTGQDVKAGMQISKEKAVELLKSDLKIFEKYVNNLNLNINQNLFDALISFSYNVGCAALGKSTLLKYIREGKSEDAIKKLFKAWCHGGGKVLPGLVKRRNFEAELFFKK